VEERGAAPEPLELVRAFVNSRDPRSGRDELAGPAELAAWLAGHGLAGDDLEAGSADLDSARRVREALRSLLAANNGGPAEPADLAVLNQALDRGRPRLRILPAGQVELGALDPGLPGALGHLLGLAVTAMTDGTWHRLKACADERCRRAFYDSSRNASGVWCSMATCGSRAKMRAYYRRRREAGATS
jgi:predicted RNA-binding Zn ribbon-like protein